MVCAVINLITQEQQIYTCSPKEAVIAAYAQSINDLNTWDYNKKYSHLLEEGKSSYLCGNFSVFKDGRESQC